MTLAEFLLARIAEDEVVARAAMVDDGLIRAAIRANDAAKGRAADVAHIARHDPARVLAECEAKRRIMGLHNPCDDWSFGDASNCPELSVLASVYADHAYYHDEWRP